MKEIFNHSEHQLHAMLMVIVGQTTFPSGLFVGAVTASAVEALHPVA